LQVKHQIAVFLLFYATTNGLGGSPKLSLPQARETQGTPLLQASVICFFCEVLCWNM